MKCCERCITSLIANNLTKQKTIKTLQSNSCSKLIQNVCSLLCFVCSHLDEINTTPSVAYGVLMALRVLRHLGCLDKDVNTTEGWSVIADLY